MQASLLGIQEGYYSNEYLPVDYSSGITGTRGKLVAMNGNSEVFF